jgi:hypothetical protein
VGVFVFFLFHTIISYLKLLSVIFKKLLTFSQKHHVSTICNNTTTFTLIFLFTFTLNACNFWTRLNFMLAKNYLKKKKICSLGHSGGFGGRGKNHRNLQWILDCRIHFLKEKTKGNSFKFRGQSYMGGTVGIVWGYILHLANWKIRSSLLVEFWAQNASETF